MGLPAEAAAADNSNNLDSFAVVVSGGNNFEYSDRKLNQCAVSEPRGHLILCRLD